MKLEKIEKGTCPLCEQEKELVIVKVTKAIETRVCWEDLPKIARMHLNGKTK